MSYTRKKQKMPSRKLGVKKKTKNGSQKLVSKKKTVFPKS